MSPQADSAAHPAMAEAREMINISEHLEGVVRQPVEENGLKSGGGGAQVRWRRGSGKLGVGLKSDVWGSSQMWVKLGWVRLKSVGVGLKSGRHGLVKSGMREAYVR